MSASCKSTEIHQCPLPRFPHPTVLLDIFNRGIQIKLSGYYLALYIINFFIFHVCHGQCRSRIEDSVNPESSLELKRHKEEWVVSFRDVFRRLTVSSKVPSVNGSGFQGGGGGETVL